MVIAPTNLYGIDKHIKRVQDYLDSKLADVWHGDISIYGRAIETQLKETKILEVWTSKNDYKQLFVSDRSAAVVWFKVNNRAVDSHRLKADIDIIFTVNVKDVEGSSDYLDEKAIMNAYKIVSNCGLIENVTGIKTGIDNVFAGFDTEKIRHRDMSPFHVFSFTVQIEYFEKLC